MLAIYRDAAELPVPENSQTQFPILSDNLWRLGQTCGFLGPNKNRSTVAVDACRREGSKNELGIGEPASFSTGT